MAAVNSGIEVPGQFIRDCPLSDLMKRSAGWHVSVMRSGAFKGCLRLYTASHRATVIVPAWETKTDEQILAEFETGVAICKLSGSACYDPGA